MGLGLALAGACGGTASVSPAAGGTGGTGGGPSCPASTVPGAPCAVPGMACRYADAAGCERFAVCAEQRWLLTATAACGAGSGGVTGTGGSSIEPPDDASRGAVDSGVVPSDAGSLSDGPIADAAGGADSGTGEAGIGEAGTGEDGDASTCDAAQAGWQHWWDTLVVFAGACVVDTDCEYVTLGDACRQQCAIPLNASRVGTIAPFMQTYSFENCATCAPIISTCPDHAPPAVFCDRGMCQYVTPWQ